MFTVLTNYLENVRAGLRLGASDEAEVVNELATHVEDRLEELTKAGLSDDDAARTCTSLLGSARLVARQLYEAHSQGTWKQASMASMPHLLFGLLFILSWWQHIIWLSIVLVLVLSAAIYGWLRGKPTWVFPWLGYTLLPVLAVGIMLIYLPRLWSLLTIPLYFLLALWWIYFLVAQTTKRDWLFGSLALLPLPVMIGWFLTVAPGARFTEYTMQRLNYFAPWIGLSFLVLALTIVAFIRLRQRWLRISLLILSGVLTLTMVAYYAHGGLNLPTLLGLILVMWGVFLVPPLLERLARRKYREHKMHQLFLAGVNYDTGVPSDTKNSHSHR